MITLYELKTNSFCRCFVRTPYYIKNFVLLGILSFMLIVIYGVYFRRDGLMMSSISRVLKGLNSETFNYLESSSESLRLTKLLNNYQAQITSNQFMDDCVRINKPCKFEGLAKTWPGFEKWRHGDQGYDYLKKKLNDHQVEVYVGLEEQSGIQMSSLDSFKNTTKTRMRYSEFLKKMDQDQVTVAMKDSNEYIIKALESDIVQPQFMSDYNDLKKIEVMQSSLFVNPAHYENYEQILCTVDGYSTVKLIPQIYRQEVYAGKDKVIVDPDAPEDEGQSKLEAIPKNYSPIDFFNPDMDNYPNYEEVGRKYTVILHEGDCLYIPAFYFHQYMAKSSDLSQPGFSALMVSLKYKGNSAILHAFIDAVENNILT